MSRRHARPLLQDTLESLEKIERFARDDRTVDAVVRLYPTKPQQKDLERTLELCRQVYNAALQEAGCFPVRGTP